MCRLNHLKVGEKGVIREIENSEIKKRLLDIGFTKGSMIECLMEASFNGPVAYKIKNTVIALRKNDCKKIYVEVSA